METLTKYVAGGRVRLQIDQQVASQTADGSLLRYVYLGSGTLVNQLLLRDGAVRLGTDVDGFLYHASFVSAEKAAQREKVGLWGKCAAIAQMPNESVLLASADQQASQSAQVLGLADIVPVPTAQPNLLHPGTVRLPTPLPTATPIPTSLPPVPATTPTQSQSPAPQPPAEPSATPIPEGTYCKSKLSGELMPVVDGQYPAECL
jgi:hypothetical protein